MVFDIHLWNIMGRSNVQLIRTVQVCLTVQLSLSGPCHIFFQYRVCPCNFFPVRPCHVFFMNGRVTRFYIKNKKVLFYCLPTALTLPVGCSANLSCLRGSSLSMLSSLPPAPAKAAEAHGGAKQGSEIKEFLLTCEACLRYKLGMKHHDAPTK